jgi:hypothetical protein
MNNKQFVFTYDIQNTSGKIVVQDQKLYVGAQDEQAALASLKIHVNRLWSPQKGYHLSNVQLVK